MQPPNVTAESLFRGLVDNQVIPDISSGTLVFRPEHRIVVHSLSASLIRHQRELIKLFEKRSQFDVSPPITAAKLFEAMVERRIIPVIAEDGLLKFRKSDLVIVYPFWACISDHMFELVRLFKSWHALEKAERQVAALDQRSFNAQPYEIYRPDDLLPYGAWLDYGER